MSEIIYPGSVIGVLGSGQLGRMFAIAARQMGYRVQYTPTTTHLHSHHNTLSIPPPL